MLARPTLDTDVRIPFLSDVIDPTLVRDRRRAATLSLVVGGLVLALKMTAWVITGSATILSDALESVVHVVATGFMFGFFMWSQQPPDDDHPYGHGSAAHLSIGFEGGMIFLAGLAVLWQAGAALWTGRRPEELTHGLWLVGIAAAVNLFLGIYLVRTGRRTRSDILVADGQHVLSDVWTSGGVLLGVALMTVIPVGPWRGWVDGGLAILLAGIILFTAIRLIRQAISGIMDTADQTKIATVVSALAEIREPEWLDVHNLRLRSAGDRVFVDFHMTVPGDWSIERAHQSMDRIEEHVLAKLQAQGTVLVHLDYPHLPGDPTPIAAHDWKQIPLTTELATRWKD
jgi:cation diffusion facilitator family transporter